MDLADSTIDVLVIPKFDRMTRGLATWLRIERILLESGGAIVSVADGDLDPSKPDSRFILRQRAQMAEYELDMIRDRLKRWHRQRAYAGKPLVSGRRPFGYAAKDRSEVDEAEAEVITTAAELLLRGKSLRSVVAWANSVATTPTGRPWHVMNFRQMLLSPGIAGLRAYDPHATDRHHRTIVAQGTWPPILDRQTWERLCARLTRTPAPKGRPPRYLLSGLLRCGNCGEVMHSAQHKGTRQYACRARPGQRQCGRVVIYAEPVERLVSARVLDRLEQGPGLATALAGLGDERADAAAAELAEAEANRDGIEQMRVSGLIKDDAFLRMHGPAEERVQRAYRALQEAIGRTGLAGLPSAPEELRAWWADPETSLDERRDVLTSALEYVTIAPSGPRMSRFDAERVVIPREAWKV